MFFVSKFISIFGNDTELIMEKNNINWVHVMGTGSLFTFDQVSTLKFIDNDISLPHSQSFQEFDGAQHKKVQFIGGFFSSIEE
jgi:hypothetical protein